MSKPKQYLRKYLLELIKWTEEDVPGVPVNRVRKQGFWEKEVHLPNLIVAVSTLISIFFLLSFELGFTPFKLLGLGILLVSCFLVIWVYLRIYRSELIKDREAMMLLGILMVFSVLLMIIFKNMEWYRYSTALMTPVAASALLTAFLLSRRLALIVSVILCVILALLNNFDMKYFYVHLFGCLAGAWSVPMVRHRSDITGLGLKISFINVISAAAVWFIHGWPDQSFKLAALDVLFAAISSIVSIIIVLTVLNSLEKWFSRTTNLKLIELSDFNTPVLKRLMVEAPGTYHHSLVVASMAEQAAESISSNSLLARVGAYYHDIGKLVKPEYFIENQQSMGNPHDPLTPTMSTLVVISHIKEGVALAKEYDIDKVIIDCIEQHQGTSLIHYFYQRALEQNTDVEEESFRYPGPKPKMKETAILMLADAAEAACRALEDPSPGRIKDTVEKIINNKFIDGQFSECPITLRDLSNIAESLVTTLNGIYHARIEYKEENKNAE